MTNTKSSKRPRRMAREPKNETAVALDKTEGGTLSPDYEVQAAPLKPPTKTEAVLLLLKQVDGATLAELVAATGWLPHTTRAALTGLKKKGHQITRDKVEGVSRYTLAETERQ